MLILGPLLCIGSGLFAEEMKSTSNQAIKQGTLVEPTKGPIVVLTDGGLIVARPAGISTPDKKDPKSVRKLLLDSTIFGQIKIPTDAVAGILFHPPPGMKARDKMVAKLLADLQPKRRADDQVTLVNGDQLDGPLLGIKGRQITVETTFGRTEIKTNQITSIAFGSKKDTKEKTPKLFTGWSDGSRFAVDRLLKSKKNVFHVWLNAGNRLKNQTPWTAQADQLRFLQPLGGETIVYLSDLTPSEYKHVPFLDRQWKLGKDRNVLGQPLRSGGVLYPKGLGTTSRSTIAYTLAEPFSRFETSLAIDDSTDGRGSVIFRVLLDGKTVYTSPTIRGEQRPVPISIDVTDAKLLELEIDYADRGDQLDRANLLDARLRKSEP